jgi:iron complex outermembrane receptor protein
MANARWKTLLWGTSACVGALLWNSGVRAQQDAGTSVRAPNELAEIIVTARKRSESLHDVPVTETAITQATLENLQVTEVTDLPGLVPGLVVGHSLLSIGSLISIRGIGTSSNDPGVDQSVSLNLDGLSLGQGLAFSAGSFDLAQIEVLKGPQELFYGKGSPGGVISLRSADPTDHTEVIARAQYEFESINPRAEFILSGPVTDTLKLRLAAMYSASAGYFYNEPSPIAATGALPSDYSRAPRSRDYMVRGTAVWSPSSQFDARLKLNLVRDAAANAETLQLTSCPQGANFAPFLIPFTGGDNCVLDRTLRIVNMNPSAFPGILNGGQPFLDLDQDYGTLELNYRPTDELTFTSLTAGYALVSSSLVNTTETSAAAPALAVENYFKRHEFTEEIRLNSSFKAPVNFTVGGFYEDGSIADDVILLGNTDYHVPGNLLNGWSNVDIKTLSTFGQVRWQIVPNLELAGGLRWTDEKRYEYETNLQTNTSEPVGVPNIRAKHTAPEVTLTFKPTDDVTLYGAYKQGYKSGSFSIATPPAPGQDNAFGDERVIGYEVGAKNRFLDRQLEINVAAYNYKYNGLQESVDVPEATGGGLPVIQTINAASARTYGVDLDLLYRPVAVEGLGVNFSANWDHARFLKYDNAQCWGGQTVAEGCNQIFVPATGLYVAQNASGTPLVRAPDLQLNFGFNYSYPLANAYKLVFTNNNSFSSRYVAVTAVNRPNNDNYQSSYAKVDLGVTLQSADGRWEVALLGKNINNKIIAGFCSNSNYANGAIFGGQVTGGTVRGPAGIDEMGCFSDPGRAVWLKFTVKPFG